MAVSNKSFPVMVRDRTGIVFEGEVRGITSYNPRGMFDVLPVHSNFITILRKKLILHNQDGTKTEMNLESGVMRVMSNKVEIYIGIE